MVKNQGEKIGAYVQRVMSSSDLKNAEILKLVLEQFPTAETTIACIAWYRSDLKKKPVAKVETLETIDLEIKAAEAKLEELRTKREAWLTKNKAEMISKKAELLKMLEQIEELETE